MIAAAQNRGGRTGGRGRGAGATGRGAGGRGGRGGRGGAAKGVCKLSNCGCRCCSSISLFFHVLLAALTTFNPFTETPATADALDAALDKYRSKAPGGDTQAAASLDAVLDAYKAKVI